MRQLSATLETPTSCDCCGNAMQSLGAGMSRGKFRLEFTEPAEFALGELVKFTMGGGKLQVALRQNHGSNRGWGLRPHFNPDAFGKRVKTETTVDRDSGQVWYHFSFDLPAEFRPWYSTWWAELVFVEIQPYKQGYNGGLVEAHNAGTLRVKLETLD